MERSAKGVLKCLQWGLVMLRRDVIIVCKWLLTPSLLLMSDHEILMCLALITQLVHSPSTDACIRHWSLLDTKAIQWLVSDRHWYSLCDWHCSTVLCAPLHVQYQIGISWWRVAVSCNVDTIFTCCRKPHVIVTASVLDPVQLMA